MKFLLTAFFFLTAMVIILAPIFCFCCEEDKPNPVVLSVLLLEFDGIMYRNNFSPLESTSRFKVDLSLIPLIFCIFLGKIILWY